jgi:hypothetical protein
MKERGQFVVVASGERSRHDVVADTSGAGHHAILPATEDLRTRRRAADQLREFLQQRLTAEAAIAVARGN